MKRIIVLVGMPGSGKEEFVKVAQGKGYSIVRMGDVVRAAVKGKGMKLTDRNVGTLAHEEREKSGYGVWASRTLALINKSDEKKVVIDGCRGDAEVSVFKQNFSDLDVVAIYSSPEMRYGRLQGRARADAPMTIDMFYERDQRELKWGIGNAFIMADYMIVNERSLEEFRDCIDRVLDRISSKK